MKKKSKKLLDLWRERVHKRFSLRAEAESGRPGREFDKYRECAVTTG